MSYAAPEPGRSEEGAVEPTQSVAVDRSGWGAAIALAVMVLAFGVVDPFMMVALPLGIVMLALPRRGWERVFGVAVLAWALLLTPSGDSLVLAGRGWALLIGAAFLTVTLYRPVWSAFSRALVAVAVGTVGTGLVLAATGTWNSVDAAMAAHFQRMAPLLTAELDARFAGASWAADLGVAFDRMVRLWATLFPGLLALQSLAALGLVSWVFGRAQDERSLPRPVSVLREFRFHDGLVWVLVVALVMVALPAGAEAARVGYNLLLVMGALYAVRGIAVFMYLGRGGVSVLSLVFGTLAVVLFFQIVLTAAVLVGLGDTWLDVRGRAAAASRA